MGIITTVRIFNFLRLVTKIKFISNKDLTTHFQILEIHSDFAEWKCCCFIMWEILKLLVQKHVSYSRNVITSILYNYNIVLYYNSYITLYYNLLLTILFYLSKSKFHCRTDCFVNSVLHYIIICCIWAAPDKQLIKMTLLSTNYVETNPTASSSKLIWINPIFKNIKFVHLSIWNLYYTHLVFSLNV